MKKFAIGVALAAVALALVISGPSGARADESGDPGFCYTGWVKVPGLKSEDLPGGETATEYIIYTFVRPTYDWACLN